MRTVNSTSFSNPFCLHCIYSINTELAGRLAAFYSDSFLQAFPMILQEIEPKLYEPPEDTFRRVYILRTLQRFAGFFGLADVEQVSDKPLNREYRIRATSLLSEVVQWHL